MKRMYLAALTLAGVLLGQATAFADEGMWLIQDINAALEKKMQERGLKLSAGEIYNADAPGAAVSDAIVSLGFYCTGSIISDQGLLITNHHCAYSDVFALSTPEHNYLEEGYWAVRSDQELPIPDKQVFFLKRVLDITGEVKNLRDDLAKKGLPCGMRRVSHILESKYKKDTGKDDQENSASHIAAFLTFSPGRRSRGCGCRFPECFWLSPAGRCVRPSGLRPLP